MATTDFLDEKRSEIEARIAELKPLAEEYQRLEVAADALANVPKGAGNGSGSREHSQRARGEIAKARGEIAKARAGRQATARVKAVGPSTATQSASKARADAATGRRGRPKGSGKRGDEAVAIITENPGIRIADLAAKMGMKPNYLYRVLPALEAEGRIVKDGKGWKPVES